MLTQELNWESTTVSGIFGYETLKELKAASMADYTKAVLLATITNDLTAREQYILAATLGVILGVEFESSKDMLKYFFKLPDEDVSTLTAYLIGIIDNMPRGE